MAILIKSDGTKTEVKPAKGKKFTLEEMQKLVGGLIQQVPLSKRYKTFSRVWCDEEGWIKDGAQMNEVAMLEIGLAHRLAGDVVFTVAGEF